MERWAIIIKNKENAIVQRYKTHYPNYWQRNLVKNSIAIIKAYRWEDIKGNEEKIWWRRTITGNEFIHFRSNRDWKKRKWSNTLTSIASSNRKLQLSRRNKGRSLTEKIKKTRTPSEGISSMPEFGPHPLGCKDCEIRCPNLTCFCVCQIWPHFSINLTPF